MKIRKIAYPALIALLIGGTNMAMAQGRGAVERPQAGAMDPLGLKGQDGTVTQEMLPPGIRKKAAERLAEVKQKGYVTVPDQAVDGYTLDKLAKYLQPLEGVQPQLAVTLADVAGTPFEQMEFHGVIPESQTADGRWAGVSRIFTLQNKALVRLYEWDYMASGGGAALQQELVNETVSGHPASLLVEKTSKGAAITSLTWIADGKFYTLSMSGHVRGVGMSNRLIELANSVM